MMDVNDAFWSALAGLTFFGTFFCGAAIIATVLYIFQKWVRKHWGIL